MTNSNFQKVGAGQAAANYNVGGGCTSHVSNNGKVNATAVMVFDNPEFGHIRISLDDKGEPLFCGKDVCETLGYRRADMAIHQHVAIHDAVKHCIGLMIGMKKDGSPIIQQRQILFVNESGLYSLIFGSKLPIAQKFKHWVTSVVLPQIRKTGGFIPLHEGENEEDTIRHAEEILRKTLLEKEAFIAQQQKLLHNYEVDIEQKSKLLAEQEVEIDRLLPKALYADNVLDSISCYTTTQIAKELGMTAQELNRWLCAERIQYYQSGQYLLYAEYAHRGLAKSRTHFDLFVGQDVVHTRMFLVWTERGRKFIHQLAKGA